ncbi:hypothetical protein, partial [Cedecea sp.]|uniref:hypothetical protein n=1 Tax=Cedecea sp. TaxID=1970739 RepID=UPI002F41B14F
EQRKRAIVGNESRTTPTVWVIAGGFTASAAMSSPGAGGCQGAWRNAPDTFTVQVTYREHRSMGERNNAWAKKFSRNTQNETLYTLAQSALF